MKIKQLVESVLKRAINNTVQKPVASVGGIGLEKMPESLKILR